MIKIKKTILGADQCFECEHTGKHFLLGADKNKIGCDCYLSKQKIDEPFFAFCNNTLCLFASDPKDFNLEAAKKESWLARVYYSYIAQNGLVGYFDKFNINGIQYKLIWKPSKKFDYKLDSKKKTLTINHVNHNRLFCMTKILQDLNGLKVLKIVESVAKDMQILDKFQHIYIEDCYEYNFVREKDKNPEASLTPAVFGTSYSTRNKTPLVFDIDSSNIACTLILSPIILYMTEQQQRMLITHELCHIKIGNVHGHDQYFWFMFKWFSGQDKHKDLSYRKDQEYQDTVRYDNHCAKRNRGNEYLITCNFKKYKKYWKKKGWN